MNIALEQTEEYVNGQLKNKYGDAFIRGNNGKCLDLHRAACVNDAQMAVLNGSTLSEQHP